MTYVLLDDNFHSHGKVLDAGNAGAGLFARALSYCGAYLTDGFVPDSWARSNGSAKLRDKLVAVGLWVRVEGGELFPYEDGADVYIVTVPGPGYFVADYLTLNPSKRQVEDKRAAKSEAGKKGAESRWRGGKRMAGAIAGANVVPYGKRMAE